MKHKIWKKTALFSLSLLILTACSSTKDNEVLPEPSPEIVSDTTREIDLSTQPEQQSSSCFQNSLEIREGNIYFKKDNQEIWVNKDYPAIVLKNPQNYTEEEHNKFYAGYQFIKVDFVFDCKYVFAIRQFNETTGAGWLEDVMYYDLSTMKLQALATDIKPQSYFVKDEKSKYIAIFGESRENHIYVLDNSLKPQKISLGSVESRQLQQMAGMYIHGIWEQEMVMTQSNDIYLVAFDFKPRGDEGDDAIPYIVKVSPVQSKAEIIKSFDPTAYSDNTLQEVLTALGIKY